MSQLVYTIGENENGQQGDGTDEDVEKLQKLELSQLLNNCIKIKTIVTGGEGSTYILLNNDYMIVFGYDEYGQLGVDYQKIKNIVSYLYRNAGITQILSLDIEMMIISFCNKFDKMDAQLTPVLIDTFKIKFISQGIRSRHRFIVTTNDEIYACGWNSYGQLGSLTENDGAVLKYVQKNTEFNMWRKINFCNGLHKESYNNQIIKQIECGWKFTIFLTTDGELYQRGRGFSSRSKIELDLWTDDGEQYNPSETMKIESICCGMHHTLALAETGEVISFGANGMGELGQRRQKERRYDPWQTDTRVIQYFINNKIVIQQIACGESHNVALDTNGKIYCWGRNKCYECGNDNTKNVYVPELNCLSSHKDIIKIVDIKCGAYHNVVKSTNNEYYLWGANDFSQCLEYEYEYCELPRKLNIDKDKVIGVYVGYNETRIVTNAPLTKEEIDNPTVKIRFKSKKEKQKEGNELHPSQEYGTVENNKLDGDGTLNDDSTNVVATSMSTWVTF